MTSSVVNDFLDEIDESLIGISGKSVEVCKEQAKRLREELEKNQKQTDEDINLRIANLAAKVELLESGVEISQSSLEGMNRKNPRIQIQEEKVSSTIHVTANGATISKEMMSPIIEGFKTSLELSKSKDSAESRKIIDSVKNTFAGYEYQSQELDLKIAEADYELMNKYLQNGEMEEASEYTKTFGTDMRIHIRNRMLRKIKEEAISSTPELFVELTKYLSGEKQIDVNDIEFWKTMIEIETGKQLGVKEKTPRKIEEKKEKPKTEISKEDKKKYKIIKVRYDKNEQDGINKKDYEKLKTYLKKEKKNNDKQIKIVFEEGITSIPDGPVFDYTRDDAYNEIKSMKNFVGSTAREADERYYNSNGHLVEEIQLPKTLEKIGKHAFERMTGLRNVYLIETKIEELPECCFSESGISQLVLPRSIRKIGKRALERTYNLSELDLSETNVEIFDEYCLDYSFVKDLKLPKCLRVIGNSALHQTKIESLDLTETQVEELGEYCLAGTEIKELKLPKGLKKINKYALNSTSTLESLDLSETQVEELSGYCLEGSGIKELKLPKCLKKIGKRALALTEKLKRIDLNEAKIQEVAEDWNYHSGIMQMRLPIFRDNSKIEKNDKIDKKDNQDVEIVSQNSQNDDFGEI